MTNQSFSRQPERFLPGGLPLHGSFARFEGTVFACRPEYIPGAPAVTGRLILTGRADEQTGPGWRQTPALGGQEVEWTRLIDASEADEVFFCIATAMWHGIKLGGLVYDPATHLIGGYVDDLSATLRPVAESMREFGRVDRSTWYGAVPLNEIERLEISRSPSPAPPSPSPTPSSPSPAPSGRPRWRRTRRSPTA